MYRIESLKKDNSRINSLLMIAFIYPILYNLMELNISVVNTDLARLLWKSGQSMILLGFFEIPKTLLFVFQEFLKSIIINYEEE